MPTLEIYDACGVETHDVCGEEVRVIDVMPEEFIGVDNGRYLTIFWQGAEIARIMPRCGDQYAEGNGDDD